MHSLNSARDKHRRVCSLERNARVSDKSTIKDGLV